MDLHDAFITVLTWKSRWVLYFHSCMFLMMTNVALSLQWCVLHIRAGGCWREEWGRHHGWREKDGEKDMVIGDGGYKWGKRLRGGATETDSLRRKAKSRFTGDHEDIAM